MNARPRETRKRTSRQNRTLAEARARSAKLPRIFGILDETGRVAVVFERRRRKWWRLGRWDLVSGAYDEGAWFRGSLYPQRCDLSSGGRWLTYFAYKHGSTWPAGPTYNAISRPPWLKALAAWEEIGTWSRGMHCGVDSGVWEVGEPIVGDPSVHEIVGGMRPTTPSQFATERRRGWQESALVPLRDPKDIWDEHRDVVMEKPSPCEGRQVILSVRGAYQAFRTAPDSHTYIRSPYSLSRCGVTQVLTDVQWADWTWDGHLAVATRASVLQIRDPHRNRILYEVFLGFPEPKPVPAPSWADEW